MRSTWLVSLLLAVSACVAEGPEVTPGRGALATTPSGVPETEQPPPMRVRDAGTTLWLEPVLVRGPRPGGGEDLVLRGRASRNIVEGRGFVFDDVYGEVATLTPRTFEMRWSISEAAGLLAGVQQFIGLSFTPSSTRPEHMVARIIVRPWLRGFSGSGAFLVREVVPVRTTNGGTSFTLSGSAPSAIQELRVSAGGVDVPVVVNGKEFTATLDMANVLALVGTAEPILFSVRTATGTKIKRARLGLAVAELGFTEGDAYETWPPVDPTVTVTDVDIVTALARADLILDARPGFADDAALLVGDERAVQLHESVRMTIEHHLEQSYGQPYPTAAAITVAFDAIIASTIDLAYARPLDHVEPLPPVAGDLARARDIAADGLLTYLAGIDLADTEFGRPLPELTRVYRGQHLASLAEFRTDAEIHDPSDPERILFLGRWLGAYVEIAVSPATGTLAGVYFEID